MTFLHPFHAVWCQLYDRHLCFALLAFLLPSVQVRLQVWILPEQRASNDGVRSVDHWQRCRGPRTSHLAAAAAAAWGQELRQQAEDGVGEGPEAGSVAGGSPQSMPSDVPPTMLMPPGRSAAAAGAATITPVFAAAGGPLLARSNSCG